MSSGPRVVVYTTWYCGYCRRARRLLDAKGIAYDAHDVTGDTARRRWLLEVTGRRTVPQIFIDGRSIGGFTELDALDRKGELDAILNAPPSS